MNKKLLTPALIVLLAMPVIGRVSADSVSSQYIDMTERKAKIIKALAVDDSADVAVDVHFLVHSKDVATKDIRLWMVTSSEKIELDVLDEGIVEIGPHESKLSDLQGFEVTPDAKREYGFAAKVTPRLPATTTLTAAEVRNAVNEMNALIKKEAGALSLIAPKMKGIRARTGAGTSATLKTTKGRVRVVNADPEGWVDIKWQLSQLASISFDAAPTAYDFLD